LCAVACVNPAGFRDPTRIRIRRQHTRWPKGLKGNALLFAPTLNDELSAFHIIDQSKRVEHFRHGEQEWSEELYVHLIIAADDFADGVVRLVDGGVYDLDDPRGYCQVKRLACDQSVHAAYLTDAQLRFSLSSSSLPR